MWPNDDALLKVVGQAPPTAGDKPPMRWSAANSGFVLCCICELVGKGASTDKGFKETYVNQLYNHFKWRQRWAKVCKAKGPKWSSFGMRRHAA